MREKSPSSLFSDFRDATWLPLNSLCSPGWSLTHSVSSSLCPSVCLFFSLFLCPSVSVPHFSIQVLTYYIALPGLEFNVNQPGLELRDLPAFASWVLGLKVCITMPGLASNSQFTFLAFQIGGLYTTILVFLVNTWYITCGISGKRSYFMWFVLKCFKKKSVCM